VAAAVNDPAAQAIPCESSSVPNRPIGQKADTPAPPGTGQAGTKSANRANEGHSRLPLDHRGPDPALTVGYDPALTVGYARALTVGYAPAVTVGYNVEKWFRS